MAEIVPDEGLDWILGQVPRAACVQASSLWLGLFTSQTACAVVARTGTMSACITEPAGGAYARQLLAASDWGAPATSGNGRRTASVQETFPTATGAWGNVNGFFVTTASTGNERLIMQANFDDNEAVNVQTNDVVKVTPRLTLEI